MATKCGRQVGDTCKITRPRAPGEGDKWETSGRQVGDKSKITRLRLPRAKNKWETSVKSCDPEHPEREKTSGRQV